MDLLRRHPVEARAFLQVSHTTPTAEVVDGLFKFEMSDEGSNRNQNEQAILFNWNQFLEDVEHSLATSTVFDPCTNSQVQVQLSLQSVVACVTGSTGIPPLGFSPQPKIFFITKVLTVSYMLVHVAIHCTSL